MAQVVREVRERSVDYDADSARVAEAPDHKTTVAARIIYYIGGVIMFFIGLRILLSLMGANRSNDFASFVYGVSHPFVAPFFGLFNYQMQYGVSRFEFESLIALLVWGAVTLGLAWLVTIGRTDES